MATQRGILVNDFGGIYRLSRRNARKYLLAMRDGADARNVYIEDFGGKFLGQVGITTKDIIENDDNECEIDSALIVNGL